jgi:hypothetical protein
MGVRRTLAAALAAPLLLLAACGGTDTSIADPPISPDATTSSPTGQPHRESPEHVIRRFVATSNLMESRGFTMAYLDLTHGCKPCTALASQIDAARRHGGFYRSKGWAIKGITTRPTESGAASDLVVESAPTTFRMSANGPIRHYSGGRFTFHITLASFDSRWAVTNVVQVAT